MPRQSAATVGSVSALRRPSPALVAEPVDPEVERARRENRRAYRDVFGTLLEEGVARGEMGRSTRPCSRPPSSAGSRRPDRTTRRAPRRRHPRRLGRQLRPARRRRPRGTSWPRRSPARPRRRARLRATGRRPRCQPPTSPGRSPLRTRPSRVSPPPAHESPTRSSTSATAPRGKVRRGWVATDGRGGDRGEWRARWLAARRSCSSARGR